MTGRLETSRDRTAGILETEFRETKRSFQAWLQEFFPAVEDRQVARIITTVLDYLEPVCEKGDLEHPGIFVRGSSVIRTVLNPYDGLSRAPSDYWSIPEVYQLAQCFEPDHNQEGVNKQLLAEVFAGLTHGPDLDIMVRKKADYTDDDLLTMFSIWKEWAVPLLQRRKWNVEIKHVDLAKWNGGEDKRRYYCLEFTKQDRRERKIMFRMEIGEAPDEITAAFDGRLSMYMTSFDIVATAPLVKTGDRWQIVLLQITQKVLSERNLKVLGAGATAANKFIVAGRLELQALWWVIDQFRGKSLEDFVANQLPPHTLEKHLCLPFGDGYWSDVNSTKINEIARREAEIVALQTLGATVDPFKWLLISDAIGSLRFTKLGQLLKSTDVFRSLICGADTGMERRFLTEFWQVVREASLRYHNGTLSNRQIRYVGPFMLLERLKTGGILPKLDITLAEWIDLINPVSYLRSSS
ncbi:hypothetical protein KKB64_01540 [Patescibacteria group bacterium]|nr:hypothetical protein [Patescibacteria group bacterium]MBU1472454.1 hypothetical protein [Patescibacteria group bacterium]MBU2460268.1 hypothetical protein [Patescibacteria group bacterium]MBU2543946.1 hypothetical protein [Patescibacteria group bacterium]